MLHWTSPYRRDLSMSVRTAAVLLASLMLGAPGSEGQEQDQGHPAGQTGWPRAGAIEVHGAERTRRLVVVQVSGLRPGEDLTPEVAGRAVRRLRELPVSSSARMTYETVFAAEDGRLADIEVFIDEHQLVPTGWSSLATHGARALFLHEVRVGVAGALGGGELLTGTWRWSAGRPRVAISLATPSPRWLPGIVTFDGSWEQQSYARTSLSGDVAVVREGRRRAGVLVSDWPTSWLQWQTGAALDHVRAYDGPGETRVDARQHVALESALNLWLAGDRIAVTASGGWWTPLGGGNRFGTGGLRAAWRSTTEPRHPVWSAVTEIGIATRVAPLALWPSAGTNHARGGLLRAHRLLQDGVVTGPAFGRAVAQGSFEYERPIRDTPIGLLAVAGFVDSAQAWRRLDADTSPLYVDVGVGLLVRSPSFGGAIRLDVARGLRGGGTTVSASWGGAWPR